jgi:hypothetical protein
VKRGNKISKYNFCKDFMIEKKQKRDRRNRKKEKE